MARRLREITGWVDRDVVVFGITLVVVGVVVGAPSLVSAQEPVPKLETENAANYLPAPAPAGPEYQFMLGPRIRAIHIPNGALDPFLDTHGSTWDDRLNLSYGLEFAVRKPKSHDWVFSIDWADTRMNDTWWLQKDDPARDADWTEFDISLLTVDASYYEWWELLPELGFYLGGGIGLAVVLGEVTKFQPSESCQFHLGPTRNWNKLREQPQPGGPQTCMTGEEPNLTGDTEKESIPPVLPSINIGGGGQITLAKQFFVRGDLGFKGAYLYAGTTVGMLWW